MKQSIMRTQIAFLVLFITGSMFAQPNFRVIDLQGFTDPSDYSYISGSGYDLTLTVENIDDNEETETVAFMYLTDKMILNSTPPAEMVEELEYTIPALSTIEVPVLGFDLNTEQFRVGGNIVVIWPSFVDSLTDTLDVVVNVSDTLKLGYEGFLESPEMRKEVIQRLHGLSNSDALPEVKSISLYRLNGQLIHRYEGDAYIKELDVPSEMLLVHVETNSGTYFSFIHRRP